MKIHNQTRALVLLTNYIFFCLEGRLLLLQERPIGSCLLDYINVCNVDWANEELSEAFRSYLARYTLSVAT